MIKIVDDKPKKISKKVKVIIAILIPVVAFLLLHLILILFVIQRTSVFYNSIEDISDENLLFLSEEFDFQISEKLIPYRIFRYEGYPYVLLELNETDKKMTETLIELLNIPIEKEQWISDGIANHRCVYSNIDIEKLTYDKSRVWVVLLARNNFVSNYYYACDGKEYILLQKGHALFDWDSFNKILDSKGRKKVINPSEFIN